MLRIRPATDDDCRQLWQWANDAEVRRWPFDSARIDGDAHVDWFRAKRADPNCRVYILIDQSDQSIGLVRIDLRDGGHAEVDLSFAADRRGRGNGSESLRLACEQFFAEVDGAVIVAHIKPDNTPSIRTFERAGFMHEGTTQVEGHDAVRMTISQAGT